MLNSIQKPLPVKSRAEALQANGYQPGAPPHVRAFSECIDRGLCLDAICARCDNRGLDYQPFQRGKNYVVLGVCLRCGHAEEF